MKDGDSIVLPFTTLAPLPAPDGDHAGGDRRTAVLPGGGWPAQPVRAE